jgi:hypothetical protein
MMYTDLVQDATGLTCVSACVSDQPATTYNSEIKGLALDGQ